MNIRMLLILISALSVAPIWAGGNEEQDAGSHRRSSAPSAEVGFTSPKDGDVVPSEFVVKFSVSGMGIAPAGTDEANTGHHHLLIDVEVLPDLNLPIPKDKHFIHFGGGQTETVLNLPPGEHTLQLLFGDYAHIPHTPVVKSEVITIQVSE